eukprot:11837122-Prorocentrum_lima.AAC.1
MPAPASLKSRRTVVHLTHPPPRILERCKAGGDEMQILPCEYTAKANAEPRALHPQTAVAVRRAFRRDSLSPSERGLAD